MPSKYSPWLEMHNFSWWFNFQKASQYADLGILVRHCYTADPSACLDWYFHSARKVFNFGKREKSQGTISSPEKIAYKTFFVLNVHLAITGLLLFLVAQILLLTFITGSKWPTVSSSLTTFANFFSSYFGNILSNCLAILTFDHHSTNEAPTWQKSS